MVMATETVPMVAAAKVVDAISLAERLVKEVVRRCFLLGAVASFD